MSKVLVTFEPGVRRETGNTNGADWTQFRATIVESVDGRPVRVHDCGQPFETFEAAYAEAATHHDMMFDAPDLDEALRALQVLYGVLDNQGRSTKEARQALVVLARAGLSV